MPELSGRRYFEPFLGAASVYLRLKPSRAVLSDANEYLIDMFRRVRDAPSHVARITRELAAQDSEAWYYHVRDSYNAESPSVDRAAMFIYLNRSCYNGVFRVNKHGKFNVPYGHKPRIRIPSEDCLIRSARLLDGAELRVGDYAAVLSDAEPGDFVYLDPPYPPLNGTSFFTHYTKERFASHDQKNVAVIAAELRLRGCGVLVTNADTAEVRDLYSGWQVDVISVPRYVTGKKKHRVQELVITGGLDEGGGH